VKLTTHFYLVPSLKMCGTVPLLFECLCGITPVQMHCELWCDGHITQHIYNVCDIKAENPPTFCWKSPVLWALAVLDHQIFYTCSLCRRLACGFESFRVYASFLLKLFG